MPTVPAVPSKFRKVAKAVVAVAGFVAVAANAVATNTYDWDTLYAAGVAALVALGVYHVSNG